MSRYIKCGLLVLLIALSSCEKELDFSNENFSEKLVINSLFYNDSLWSVEISKSKNVLDTAPVELIKTAQVELYEDGNFVQLLTHKKNGIYRSLSHKPTAGGTYSLKVSYQDLPLAETENTLPETLPMFTLDTGTHYSQDGYPYKKLTVGFYDSPDDNFYSLKITADYWSYTYNDTSWQPVDSFLVNSPIYFYSEDKLFEDGQYFDFNRGVFFSDELFNGGEIKIDLFIDRYNFNLKWGAENIYIVVGQTSRDYYLYETSYQRYKNTEFNPFAQPVQVYSNVTNGHGIFAGMSNSVLKLEVK